MTRSLPTLTADALPNIRVAPPGPESRRWLERLKAHESPNVTTVSEQFPVAWDSALGAAVLDVDGNRYVDAGSGFGVAFVGHNHPRVRAAVAAQADKLVHGMGDVHPPTSRIELLETLSAVSPGDLGRGVLCTGGSEAVEVALKTAYLATGRAGVVAFQGGYHGLSLGALAGTWRPDFRGPFKQWVPGPTHHAPFPTTEAALAESLASVEGAMSAGDVGVVVVEPVQGRGGSRAPARGFLAGLRSLCDRYGALLCFDEIFTGCGRTGWMWAGDRVGVTPDLLCVGKAVGGGWPMSACLGTPAAMDAWGPATGEALHTSTFLGHPVACAAATETLRLIVDEGLAARAREDGERWLVELRASLSGVEGVVEIRGVGLMLGVELRDAAMAWKVVLGCLARGVIVLPCGGGEVIQLTPPVVMTSAQRGHVIAALAESVAAAGQA